MKEFASSIWKQKDTLCVTAYIKQTLPSTDVKRTHTIIHQTQQSWQHVTQPYFLSPWWVLVHRMTQVNVCEMISYTSNRLATSQPWWLRLLHHNCFTQRHKSFTATEGVLQQLALIVPLFSNFFSELRWPISAKDRMTGRPFAPSLRWCWWRWRVSNTSQTVSRCWEFSWPLATIWSSINSTITSHTVSRVQLTTGNHPIQH